MYACKCVRVCVHTLSNVNKGAAALVLERKVVLRYACMYASVCTYVNTCRASRARVGTQTLGRMRICVYAYMRICVYAYMRICVYAYMRICQHLPRFEVKSGYPDTGPTSGSEALISHLPVFRRQNDADG